MPGTLTYPGLSKLPKNVLADVMAVGGGLALAERNEPGVGYTKPELRGGARELWDSQESSIMLAGPAETGKTWAALSKLNALMWDYPGAQGAMVRKTYSSMHGSVLQSFRRILGKDTPIHAFGGEKPAWFDYPNGSRVFVGGMDNPQKVLSSERDVIYVNQAEELTLDDWETLTTRATGRGGVMPYAQVFGDCNPGPATHWLLNKPSLKMLYSHHEDNPTLYTAQGVITEQGRKTMSVLDHLTGTRYKRLRLGLWVGAEGLVYEGWNREIHLIDAFTIPEEWPRYRVIDFGYTNPLVCQWWASDNDGRLYMYRELYITQTLVEDAAGLILRETGDERIEATIADHDAEDRATLERRSIQTIAARKEVSPGIQDVQARLRVAGDGKPRLYIMRGALVNDADEGLRGRHKPTCTEEEFDGYIWARVQASGSVKEEPRKQDDHGMDCVRYMVRWLDGGQGVGALDAEARDILSAWAGL